ncbi:MAG: hypothetical protein ACFFDT_38515 [Candidatus Hodarchaeota archaeon]
MHANKSSIINENKSRESDSSLSNNIIERIEEKAHSIETDTIEKIQKRTLDWAKVQIFIVGTAIAILQISILIWGFSKFSEFKDLIKEKEKDIQDSTEKVNQAADKFQSDIKNEFSKLDKFRKDIDEINIQNFREEISRMEGEFQEAIIEARRLRDEAQNDRKLAKTDREAIQKLQNSFFDIFIQVDGDEDQLNKKIPELITKLNEAGFVINSSNVAKGYVDKTEVIYYNTAAEEKAKFIADLLCDEYQDIKCRAYLRRERNPREMVIKLKIQQQNDNHLVN